MYGRLLPLFFLFAIACGGGDLSVDEESAGEESTNNASTGTEMDDDESSMETPTTNESSTNNDETSPATNNSTSSNTNNETISTTNNNNNLPGDTNNIPAETNNEPQFDPMFVAVADFMREKCISCHAQGQNGNFQIPSATSTNQEVRDALEGVQATSGRLLVEPGDPAESQVYIMITNDAGEQFEPETIAIVEDWILANTPYTL